VKSLCSGKWIWTAGKTWLKKIWHWGNSCWINDSAPLIRQNCKKQELGSLCMQLNKTWC
jgi:hypothetical protein